METPRLPIINNLSGCVYKLIWGEKYVIIKCKTYARSKTIIEESLGYHFKKDSADKHYKPFFKHIQSQPFHRFIVQVLFKSDDPYLLLKNEQIELDKCCQDKDCLNTDFNAYIPVKIQGKRKSWINRGHYLNFMNWYKTRDKV